MPRELDAAVTTRRNLRDQLLATWPGLADDADTLLDTLAGLDDFEEQCIAALRAAIEREAHGKALTDLIDGMTARKRRLEDGAKSIRIAVLNAMQEAGVPRIKAADMTIATGHSKPKVVVTDEDAVPDMLCRFTRAPDKTAIAAEFAAGRDVPGALLGNPQATLTVRRS